MCCDICPFYDECDDLDETVDNCCRECPDYEGCQTGENTPGEKPEESSREPNEAGPPESAR